MNRTGTSPLAEPETPKRRGRPPTSRPPAPPPPSPARPDEEVLARLAARAAAPQQALADAGEALRAATGVYADRAAHCLARLETLRPAWADWHRRRARLDQDDGLGTWALQLGRESTLVGQIRAVVQRLTPVFEATVHGTLTVPATTTIVAGIGGRIATLGAADAHPCPPRCGCRVGMIRQHVEDAEAIAAGVPRDLAALPDLLQRLDSALRIRVDGLGAAVHRALPSAAAAVSVTTRTGDEPAEPEGA